MTELEAAQAELMQVRAELEIARAKLNHTRPRGPTYAWCREFFARTMPSVRKKMFGRQRLWQYRAVSRLLHTVGEALDAAGLGFTYLRYVASGTSMYERALRAEQVLRDRRLPDRPFRVDELDPEERRAMLLRRIAEAEERSRVQLEDNAKRMAEMSEWSRKHGY